MSKTNKTKSVTAAAPAASVSSSVTAEVKVYPHVLHVHVNGEEEPPRRKMNPSNDDAARVAEDLRKEFPGAKVTVARFS